MLLIYGDMSGFPEMTEDEQNADDGGRGRLLAWLREKGWMKAGDALRRHRPGDERPRPATASGS